VHTAIRLRLSGYAWSDVAAATYCASGRSAAVSVVKAARRRGGDTLVEQLRSVRPHRHGTCRFCGERFEASRSDRCYCSARCRAWTHRYRVRDERASSA
jgi:predicted nucleic acid-binding Zn ribbon protein